MANHLAVDTRWMVQQKSGKQWRKHAGEGAREWTRVEASRIKRNPPNKKDLRTWGPHDSQRPKDHIQF